MSAAPARWTISGMTCGACATRLERVVAKVDGVEGARVDLSTETLTVCGEVDDEALRAAVTRAGFTGAPRAEVAPTTGEDDERLGIIRVAVAAALGMQSMTLGLVLSEGGLPPELITPLSALSGLLAAPAVLWSGWPLWRATASALRAGSLGVDALVGLGAALTWIASWVAVATGGPALWFDTAAMLVALHLGGRLIEGRARRRATRAVRGLLTLTPSTALRERADGEVEDTQTALIRPGDRVHVLPGQRLPVDGIVRRGRSSLDRSLITGESTPETVGEGALVEAGAQNIEGALLIEVTGAEGGRRIDAIAEAVERSLAGRPAIVRAADRVAGALVPLIGILAVGAGLWRLGAGAGVADALMAAATVIVVTCPCALTLAAPLAVAVAAGVAAERGLVFRDADALNALATVDSVWFDKTGTLTEGALRLRRVVLEPSALGAEGPGPWSPSLTQTPHDLGAISTTMALQRAAALAAASPHPAARALLVGRGATRPVEGAVVVPGEGVEALIDGRVWRLGRAGFAGPADEGDTTQSMILACDGARVARFELADVVLPDAEEVIRELRALGLKVRVLSGDRSGAVADVAAALRVEDAVGGLSPEAKASALRDAAAEGHQVAFVGDGLNDTLAQSAASVGVAPQGAVDLTASTAGVLIVRSGLGPLHHGIRLARATRRVIHQNLAWAVLYNLIAVPLAVSGVASPLLAAAAMTLSSLTVTFNAGRLLQHAPAETKQPGVA